MQTQESTISIREGKKGVSAVSIGSRAARVFARVRAHILLACMLAVMI